MPDESTRLFRDQGFRNLFAATMASAAGASVARIAIPLTAVVALGADEFEVGLVSVFLTLPFLLVGLPAGAWVDRMRRRQVLIFCQGARSLILMSIPVLWWIDFLTIWWLSAAVLLFGICNVFYDVAYQSYLPGLVGRENLVQAHTRTTSVQQVFTLGGPALGGQLAALLTAPVSLVVTSVVLSLSSLFILRIRQVEERRESSGKRDLLGEIREGVLLVRTDRRLRALAESSAWLNLTSYAAYSITVVFLARDIGLSVLSVGIFFSISGIGGVAAAFSFKFLAGKVGHGPLLWLPLFVGAPFGLLLPMAHPGWTVWLAAAASSVVAFTTVIFNIGFMSSCQAVVPDMALGRVNATLRFLTWGVMPLGSLLGGTLADVLGTRQALCAAAAAGLLSFLPTFLSPWRKERSLPEEPTSLGDLLGAGPEPVKE
ncbi:MFS transporter [Streptomyces sp. ML-6]|uniref:MFS transporter n=1 Tax=Streptomyces sp. ML-6 TaxID=2982693 RepID=UPI0024BFD87D|nr:MFS transporter [Streptomyces sp. ML-6]MDK0523865.1 MFS transporter [Streptomyces sp. ML-6]